MHRVPAYHDVMAEVAAELRRARAGGSGRRAPEQTIVDPGLGFAKDARHTSRPSAACRSWPRLAGGAAGPSRKSHRARVEYRPTRVWSGAVAACVLGGAHIVRVHDVREMVDVVRICDAIRGEAA